MSFTTPVSGSGAAQTVSVSEFDNKINQAVGEAIATRATTAQGAKADTAVQPAVLAAEVAAREAAITAAKSRSTHTGVQPISTVDGLPAALAGLSQAIDDAEQAVRGDLGALAGKDQVGTADLLDKAVTLTRMADRNEATFIGRQSGTGLGSPQEVSATQARAILNVADGATANATDAALRARSGHTGVQPINTVDGLPAALSGLSQAIDDAEQAVREDLGALAGKDQVGTADLLDKAVTLSRMADRNEATFIGRPAGSGLGAPQEVGATQARAILNVADGATANATDAALRARGSHTGVQPINTVDGLSASLAGLSQARIDGDAAISDALSGSISGAVAALVSAAVTETELFGADDADPEAPIGAIMIDGVPSITFGPDGLPLQPIGRELVKDDPSSGVALALLLDGVPVLALDEAGDPVGSVSFELYRDEIDPPAIRLALDGGALLEFEADGRPRLDLAGADTARPLMPLVVGADLIAVGASETVVADLGPYEALTLAPGGPNHVLAVIDRPGLSAHSVIAAGPALPGMMVPAGSDELNIYITVGQSLGLGRLSQNAMVSTTPAYPALNLMPRRIDGLSDVRLGITSFASVPVLDPAIFDGFTPMVAKAGTGSGPTGETPMEGFTRTLTAEAKKLGLDFATCGFAACIGGTPYSGLKKGTQVYANLLIMLGRLVELAAEIGKRVTLRGIICKHGEADTASTTYVADQVQWQADLNTDTKAVTGQLADVHFFLTQPSTHQSSPRSALSMLELHNTSPFHHLCGPDYAFADAYDADRLHVNGAGSFWLGETLARGAMQVMWGVAEKPAIVQIIAASRTGNSVTLTYEVPVPPLAYDASIFTDPGAAGFRFFDSAGEVAITTAAVSGPAEITLTLATTPSGAAERVEYATGSQTNPRTVAAQPRGCIRDSCTDTSAHASRILRHWAVHQSFSL